MAEDLNAVIQCVADAAERLLRMDLTPEYEHRLRRDILGEAPDSARLRALHQRVLEGDRVAEITREQLWHGGWARFGTEDMTVKRKVPTTAFGVRRLLWLGLTKEDEPLARALEYLIDVYNARRSLPEGGEVNERWPELLRIRCGGLIAMIDPCASCLDELLERWRFIAENTFHYGAYDYAVCRDLQSSLLNVRGARLIPVPLQLLALRPGFLSGRLERLLLDYCWQRHLDGYLYWPDGKLDSLPASFCNPKTSRHMNTMESLVCFPHSASYLKQSILWLLAGRGDDGLWDYGPQVKDPAGYTRRLAAMDWRKPIHRKLDCTMEVLSLLKQYLSVNLADTFPVP